MFIIITNLLFRVQGSGFRVQGCGGGFAANMYRAMPEGLLIAGFPRIASLPLAGNAIKLRKSLAT